MIIVEIILLLKSDFKMSNSDKKPVGFNNNSIPFFFDRSQTLLVQMLRSIPNVMIFLVNKEHHIVMGEGAEMKKAGIKEQEIIGQRIEDIFDKETAHDLNPLLELSNKGTIISHETNINSNYYHIQVVPIREEKIKEVIAGMVIFENITEDKIKTEALKSAKSKAERSNKAKSEFLANISHEIRTPLNTLIGFTDQLVKTKLDDKQSKFLEFIRDSSNHLLSIVDETITLSQVEAGEVSTEDKAFLVKDVLDDVENILGLRAYKKGLELNSICTQRLDRPVVGDDVRIKQVLLNIVNNAIKFTNKGSVTITAEIDEEHSDYVIVKFRVIDTGIGITKENLKAIFREFKQLDAGITRHYGGSGLGLTISKKLIRLLNGKIELESEPDKGSEFIITIPLKKGPEDLKITKKKAVIDPEVLAGKSILLVDDDEMNRLLVQTIFDDWGVDYDIAVDGYHALKFIENKNYDIVLLDIHMPGISGMEVTKHIREMYKERKQPIYILAVTANVIKSNLKRFLASGMDGYLLKPFKEWELFDSIVRYIFDERTFTNKLTTTESESVKVDIGSDDNSKYDLSELKKTTKGKKTFFNKMINTFILNAEKNMKSINQHLERKEWEELGELSHKMIPSFRHLQIKDAVNILDQIENLCLYEKKYGTIPEKVNILNEETSQIIKQLKKEL